MRSLHRVTVVLAIAAVVVGAGCSDDDSTAPTTSRPAPTEVATTPAPTTVAAPPTTAAAPPTTMPATTLPTTPPPPTTTAAPAGTPVPADSKAASAPSFVSVAAGFVLAAEADGATVLAGTTDGGTSWSEVSRPPITPADCPDADLQFADPNDGWLLCQDLFSTHDGGRTWAPVTLDGQPLVGLGLGVGAGAVHVVAVTGGDAAPAFDLLVSPPDHDAFAPSGVSFAPAAGPVPTFRFAFSGNAGWVVYADRVVVGGARLGGGAWSMWTPPCTDGGGDAHPVTSPDSVVWLTVVCNEGTWTGGPPAVHVVQSTDGGTTFQETAQPPPVAQCPAMTAAGSPAAGQLVVGCLSGSSSFLVRSDDAGATWTLPDKPGVSPWEQMQFLDATHGVARVDDAVVRSEDGGHHWTLVLG